jgi:hypothetical protein
MQTGLVKVNAVERHKGADVVVNCISTACHQLFLDSPPLELERDWGTRAEVVQAPKLCPTRPRPFKNAVKLSSGLSPQGSHTFKNAVKGSLLTAV